MSIDKKWWKECAVYQIYPRSFYDSNGDGIGDICGIIEKLDYLQELGTGAVWLNPVYDSPNDDMGYDIRNYDAILEEYGNLENFDELLDGLHKRGIKLIMDLVVNHSSDEHEWFVQSKKSKDNPYRDFYYWREGKDGKEPNNWASFFTPSAWKYDENTSEWYLHLFSEKQPDLNWENEKVRKEIYAMINRWLDRGVDGFRMDVINLVDKTPDLPDANGNKTLAGYVFADEHFANGAKTHDYLKEMRKECFDGRNCMCVGETPFVDPKMGKTYINPNNKELDLIFQFELMDIDSGKNGKWEIIEWKLNKFKKIVAAWQNATKDAWHSLFWSNHDQPRPVSRFGNTSTDGLRIRSAKMLACAMHLQRGTPFIYQGEEIAMTNAPFTSISELRDIESIEFLQTMNDKEKAWEIILKKGRDNARTPMQWNANKNAGFTTGMPWIKINPNYTDINVEKSLNDENSVLNFYKKLLSIRNGSETLKYGDFKLLLHDNSDIFAYSRTLDNEKYTIICNMFNKSVEIDEYTVSGELILSNITTATTPNVTKLIPYEARVYHILR